MATQVYDKAKWHYEADNVPASCTQIQGATHMAHIFLWCVEKNFMSREFNKDFKDIMPAMLDGSMDCREFIINVLDGVFSSDELNTKGKKFVSAYYTSENTKFAKQVAYYLADYEDFVEAKLTSFIPSPTQEELAYADNAYLLMPFNEETKAYMKELIEKRYKMYQRANRMGDLSEGGGERA